MRLPALCLVAFVSACAMGPGSSGSVPSLAAAESAFAAHSVRDGMRAAFLASFTDDGMLLRETWVNNNAYIGARSDPPIVLDWRPVFVEVAASGELGLSTGPWKLTSKTKPETPAAYGQFVSIWRRDAGGPWKVAVDLGIGHPQPTLWSGALDEHVVPRTLGASASGDIASAEATFTRESSAKGARSAYSALASEAIRFYRNGSDPALGKMQALALAGAEEDKLAWTVDRVETAKSGEIGYARGSYALASAPATVAGHFMRVWRLEAGGWRVSLDVANPVAPRS